MSGQNAPNPNEHFVIPENEKALYFEVDSRVPNTGTFVLNRQDHTLGNLFRCQLLRDERTIFSGYRMPHPLLFNTILRVRSVPESSPTELAYDACEVLTQEVADLQTNFERALSDRKAMM